MTKSRANSAASRLGKAETRVCSRIPGFSLLLVTFRSETSTPSMPWPIRWRSWSTRSWRSASDASSPDRRSRLPRNWTFTSPKTGWGSDTSPASTVAHHASIREALVFARGLPVTGAVRLRCVVRFMYQAQRRNRDRYRRLGDPERWKARPLQARLPYSRQRASPQGLLMRFDFWLHQVLSPAWPFDSEWGLRRTAWISGRGRALASTI